MKLVLFILSIILLFACEMKIQNSGTNSSVEVDAQSKKNPGDTLKEKYGGDEYGMQSYVMAFLYAGENRDQDSATAAEIQRAHLKNIDSLANAGVLLVAGPFLDDGDMRGIFLFDVENVEEARKLTETDPAVKAGRLRMELKPWYGPAIARAIPDLYDLMTVKNPADE